MTQIRRWFALFALLALTLAGPATSAVPAITGIDFNGIDWAVPTDEDGTGESSRHAAAPPASADMDEDTAPRPAGAKGAVVPIRATPWPLHPSTRPDRAYLIPLKTGPPAA